MKKQLKYELKRLRKNRLKCDNQSGAYTFFTKRIIETKHHIKSLKSLKEYN